MSDTEQITFESWLAEQDEDAQHLIAEHIAGLKSALDSERNGRKTLEKQLRDAAKQLENGSEAQKQIEQMAADLNAASARAAFYEAAHGAGVRNLPLAFIAAREAGLLDSDGAADLKAMQERFPELFATSSPTAVPSHAGNGTQRPAPASEPSMDTFIRKAAGR